MDETRLKTRPVAGECILHPGETELTCAAADGDAQAFRTLVDRHFGDLFRLALSLSGKRADAEDICQETLIGAYKGVAKFDGRSSFKTWMTRILLRQAAKNWKKNRRRSAISIDAPAPRADQSGRAANAIEVRAPRTNVDLSLDLVSVIGRLNPDHRQVVVLREMQGMSYDEMAETLGIPTGTVESRLFRARAELRRMLKDYDL